MVIGKDLEKKYALISVYDKSKLNYLCRNLKKHKYEFISTGSTCKKIKSMGFNCIEVSKITNFKEIFDGRVKTLHPNIYGSILYLQDNKKHTKEFEKLKIPKIDIVIINLYPFEKYLGKLNANELIELIDIGGPSLLRAASKNYRYITAIHDIKDYKRLIQNLDLNEGKTDINYRKQLAYKVFELTSKYDKVISNWFDKKKKNKKINLRYGENPHQKAYFYSNREKSIFDFQISGKEISYNNILDVDSGLKCLNEFKEPTCVILKHNNPCGVASASKITNAFEKAYKSDSKSAFGGIVLLNKKIKKSLARNIEKFFFEIIVAPDFDKEALQLLKNKKNLILLKIGKIGIQKIEIRQTLFGMIYQNSDKDVIGKNFCKLVTVKKTTDKMLEDILFSIKVAKHLKSNAIVLSSNKQTLGIGNGQTNRIDSLILALNKYKSNFKKRKMVCVSDGFFPFTDSLKLLKKNNCNVVAQPFGSINDKKNIEFANTNNMSLYFLKNRIFKH